MLLTNNENWWNQVERMVTAGKVEKATDKSNVLFAYYNNRDYNGQSNLPEDTFEMSVIFRKRSCRSHKNIKVGLIALPLDWI